MANFLGLRFWTGLLGLAALTCGCTTVESKPPGYSYGMVELRTNGASIEEPNKPYRELWAATSQRATKEALTKALNADGRKLKHIIPLAGINERELVAGISDTGSVYIVIEGYWLSFNQRCVLAGDEWATVSEGRLRRLAEAACKREADRK